jgi:hypothetical protein
MFERPQGFLAIALCCVGILLATRIASITHSDSIHAQAPAPPGQPLAASGTITVLIDGKPINTGGVLNLRSGTGVIAAASPDPAINGTDILFSADTALMLGRATDQAGSDHSIFAISNCPNLCATGKRYAANASPTLTAYTRGQFFVFTPDVTPQPGATLNIDGLGPIAIQGACANVCWLLASGSPVNAFVVH